MVFIYDNIDDMSDKIFVGLLKVLVSFFELFRVVIGFVKNFCVENKDSYRNGLLYGIFGVVFCFLVDDV